LTWLRVCFVTTAAEANRKRVRMMMIAFIPMKSGLVLLIEGLCTQIHDFRFEIIGGLRTHLLLFFFERKNV